MLLATQDILVGDQLNRSRPLDDVRTSYGVVEIKTPPNDQDQPWVVGSEPELPMHKLAVR